MNFHLPKEQGNVLFLILIAVALFAALSYAITQSSRSSGNSINKETAETKAAALIQYANLMASEVQRARLGDNIADHGFDFHDGAGPSNSNANANCTNEKCRMFNSPNPGRMSSVKFDESYIDPRYRARSPFYGGGEGQETRFLSIQVVDIGTTENDLVLVIYGISPEICRAVNRQLWKEDVYPNEFYGTETFYSGTLSSFPTGIAVFGEESNNNYYWKAKNAGCIGRENISQPYGGDFYFVIMER